MLHLAKINSSYPIVGRSVGRGIVGSINFSVLNIAENIVRREKRGVQQAQEDAPLNGVDAYNNLRAAENDTEEELHSREEQGFAVPMPPEEIGKHLLTIANYLSQHLLDNAGYVESLINPGKMLPSGWDIAEPITAVFDRKKTSKPREVNPAHRAEARALGMSDEELAKMVERNHTNQIKFLQENSADILDKVEEMRAGAGSTEDDAHAAFDKLPAAWRLRLVAAGDRALFEAGKRALQTGMNGRQESFNELAMLRTERKAWHEYADELQRDSKFKRELDDEVMRGATRPTLLPLPLQEAKAA